MSDYGDDSRVEKIVNAIDDVWGALDVVNKNALTSHERYVIAAMPIAVGFLTPEEASSAWHYKHLAREAFELADAMLDEEIRRNEAEEVK